MRYIALLLLALLSACGGGGSLSRDPTLNYFDFAYIDKFNQPYSSIHGEFGMSARFIWDGPRGEAITEPQHVLLAYTQTLADTEMNPEGQMLWTHAVGAFVGESGLQMELWLREDAAGNGLNDDPTNAMVWSQFDGRCARDVLGTIKTDILCLSDREDPAGFITSAPDFQLRKGLAYVVHISITQSTGEMKALYAELYEEDGDTFVLVQRGMVLFRQSSFLPDQKQELRAAVARTPGSEGEPSVQYVVF